ncbi:virulence factor TspB C-terminal domain-related protein [Azotobacter beijerinckii]|uniref:virulence factor TspB C-terminal domain-related protein n=1 Tax=Azotobacter beijerinckii TaxID=170623 RepID=UPI0011601F6C|nr:virulence factor TspB C-terminal domain-related protein [Azotobacter beijerinckii]
MRCKVDKLYDLDSNKAAIDQMLQGDQFQVDQQVTQAPSFISEATSFLPKSCPPPETTSLSTGGLNVSFEYQPLCDFAEALGPLVVIVASVFSALYVGRAFGGE